MKNFTITYKNSNDENINAIANIEAVSIGQAAMIASDGIRALLGIANYAWVEDENGKCITVFE